MTGPDLALVPVDADDIDRVLAGELPTLPDSSLPLVAGRGWPHADSADGLAFARHGGRAWLVVAAGCVVGELGTKGPPDDSGSVEIGYGLAGSHRGRGLGTAAVGLLVEALRTDPAVRAVEAEVARPNTASHRLLTRLGFTEVEAAGADVRYRRELHRGMHPG